MFTVRATFPFLKHNHRVTSRRKMEKRVLAYEHINVFHALIQQRLIGWLLCARSWVRPPEI